MIKSLKNKILISLISLCCLLFACAFIPSLTAKADAVLPTEDNVFEIDYGASVKINGDGLRFRVLMDETYYNYINSDEDIKLYAYIAPVEYISAVGSAYETVAVKVGGVLDKAKIYEDEDKGLYAANVCITGLYTNSTASKILYDMEFSAVAFIRDSSEVLYYADLAQDGSGNRSLANATRTQYYVIDSALKLTSRDYSALIDTYSAWFGTESYPLTINSVEEYNAVAGKDAELFSGITIAVSSSVDVSQVDAELDGSLNVYTSYVVRFYNGEELVKTQKVLSGNDATAPALSRYGYDLSWDEDFGDILADTDVNAVWTARNDTPYTVNHYLYKTTNEANGYNLYKSEQLTGTTAQLTQAQALSLYNYTAKSFTNVAIGEGTTVNIYYNRDSMLVESAEYQAIRNYHWVGNTAILATDNNAQDLTGFYVAPLDSSTSSMVSGRDGHGKAVKFNIVGARWIGMLLTAEQSAAVSAGGTLKFWAKADSETTVTQSGGGDLTLTIGTTWAEYTVPLACYSNISASNVKGQQRYWIYTSGDCVIYIDDVTASYNTTYTVNHYFAKDDGTNYSLYKTEAIDAVIGDTTDVSVLSVNGFTANDFDNVEVLGNKATVVNVYYTKDAAIENFEGINKSGNRAPTAGSKLLDDDGAAFNIYVNNVSGLTYNVVNESGNKVLKLENVNKNGTTGTWVGIMLTARQYELLQDGNVFCFDIKTSSASGQYTENKSSRVVSVGTDWQTVIITKSQGAKIFPTANATYGQYIYFMYGFTADITVWIDNIRIEKPYTVNHYLYKTTDESDGYYLYQSELKSCLSGEYTNAQALDLYNYTAKSFSNVEIGNDTVINIYYNRDSMLVESAEYDAVRNYKWFNSDAFFTTDTSATATTNFYITNLGSASGSMVDGRDGHGKAVKYNIKGTMWFGFVLNAEQEEALNNGGTLTFWAKADSELTLPQSGGGNQTIGTTWTQITVPSSCYSNVLANKKNGLCRYWLQSSGDCVIYIDDITVIPNS